MRIAIVSTSKGMSPGYRALLVNVIPHLRALPTVDEVSIFTPPGSLIASDPDLEAEVVRGGMRGMRRAVRAYRADVAVMPAARPFLAPPVLSVPLIWNMEPLITPLSGNTVREGIRNIGRRLAIKRSCRRSNMLLMPAQLVRTFLMDRWHIPDEKISVIPLGVEAPLVGDGLHRPPAFVGNQPFLFTAAGSLRPARGIVDTIDMLGLLADRGQRPTLLIAGAPTAGTVGYVTMLEDRARQLGVGEQVVWTGHLGRAEMGWCYRNCEMFIAPTRAEGLSVLLLEALTYGCLTIAADVPATREVFGEVALYFPPGDAVALTDAVIVAQQLSPDDREQRREEAARRAPAYDWAVMASRMASLFESMTS